MSSAEQPLWVSLVVYVVVMSFLWLLLMVTSTAPSILLTLDRA